MADGQLSQLPVEVLVGSLPAVDLRLSQLPVEALVGNLPPVDLRLAQLPIEVLIGAAPPTEAQLSQLPLEVLLLEPPSTTEVQLSQVALEVLMEAEVVRAAEVAVTHLVAELAARAPATLDATQLALEHAHQQLDSASTATQLLVEVAWHHQPLPPALTVTQLLIEVIRRPGIVIPPGGACAEELPIEAEPAGGSCPPPFFDPDSENWP